jgi:hypothetical protein
MATLIRKIDYISLIGHRDWGCTFSETNILVSHSLVKCRLDMVRDGMGFKVVHVMAFMTQIGQLG